MKPGSPVSTELEKKLAQSFHRGKKNQHLQNDGAVLARISVDDRINEVGAGKILDERV